MTEETFVDTVNKLILSEGYKMNTFRNNPDGEENQRATRDTNREIFALKNMEIKIDGEIKKGNSFCKGCRHRSFDADLNTNFCLVKFNEYQNAYSKWIEFEKCEDINFMNDCSLRIPNWIERLRIAGRKFLSA